MSADKFYRLYFIFHAVISLAIDSAIVIPKRLQFGWQKSLINFHVSMNKDFLVDERPAWLQGFVWVELIFQIPFFIWAARNLPNKKVWPYALIYGVEASTTTFGCLCEVLGRDSYNMNLIGVYLPTLLIPLYMVYDFAGRLNHRKEKLL